MLTQFPSLARQYFNGWVKVARFTSYFRALWRKVVLANILGGLSSGLQLIVPVASMVLINDVLPKKDVKLLIWVSVILGLATIGAIAASFLEFYIATIYRERAGIILGLKLFEHIQSQPYLFFKNNESGYIMSHITNDANAALEVTSFMTGIGRSVVCLLSALVLLPYFSLELGILIIAVVPVYLALLFWLNRQTKDAFVIASEKAALLSRELYESLTGIYETKANCAEKYRARRYVKAAIEKARIQIKGRMLMIAGGQLTQIITLLMSLLVLTYGGAAVISGRLSLGALIGLNAVAAYLLVPINRFVQQSLQVQQAIASIERIEELKLLEGEKDSKQLTSLPRASGYIRYEKVSFAYEDRPEVFNDVSFDIHPGEVILLSGPSGIGKTTLVNLLLRFFNPISGHIFLDGVPIKDLSLKYLRNQIALVSQEVFLFSDSVCNNIRIGNLACGEPAIVEAARLANALEFIEQLPNKLNTKVGERGSRLSGGQRQRIAIARALIRDAPILILDEATSAIDQGMEVAVHDALRELMKDRTTIIIAHHASAFIEYVDRVFLLEDGNLRICPPPAITVGSVSHLEARTND